MTVSTEFERYLRKRRRRAAANAPEQNGLRLEAALLARWEGMPPFYSWMALRPVLGWQFAAFLKVAGVLTW